MIDKKPALVRSVARAADILKTLGDGVYTLREICARLDLSKATVHRLLRALEASGLVVHDILTRQYLLGPLVVKLASNPLIAHESLRMCSLDEMSHLRDVTGETVALQIRVGMLRLFLEEVPSLQSIRHVVGKGHVAPIYSGSAGRILLSELPKGELDKILKHITTILPSKTQVDTRLLVKEIETARTQGYSVALGEHVPGGAGISVPIKNYVCPVALSVFGPGSRFKNPLIILNELKASGERISRNLAGSNRNRSCGPASVTSKCS